MEWTLTDHPLRVRTLQGVMYRVRIMPAVLALNMWAVFIENYPVFYVLSGTLDGAQQQAIYWAQELIGPELYGEE